MKVKRISSKGIEISRAEDTQTLFVEGYAAVYDSESKPLDLGGGKTFVERIERGAFDNSVKNISNQKRDCVATFQHDRSTMMARTASGTLELSSDDYGLKFRFDIPKTSIGDDVAIMLERGDLNQCSFVATVNQDDYKMARNDAGEWRQTISRFNEIYDISLVIDPAYDATFVSEISRSIEDIEKADKESEVEVALKESQTKMLNKLIARANEKE